MVRYSARITIGGMSATLESKASGPGAADGLIYSSLGMVNQPFYSFTEVGRNMTGR